jgi:hypothetical protein
MQKVLRLLALLTVGTGATHAQMTPTAQQGIDYLEQQRINQCRINAMNRRNEDAQRLQYFQQQERQQNEQTYRCLELILGP